MGRVITSKPVLGLSSWNAKNLPSGRQERAYCGLLLSVRRWASPAPSERIHQRLGTPPFSCEVYTILWPSGVQTGSTLSSPVNVRRVRVSRSHSYTQMSLFLPSTISRATRFPSGENVGL